MTSDAFSEQIAKAKTQFQSNLISGYKKGLNIILKTHKTRKDITSLERNSKKLEAPIKGIIMGILILNFTIVRLLYL